MNEKRETRNEKRISFWHPASLICTVFGVGKIPFAPGTWGSLVGLGIVFFYSVNPLIILVLFFVGVFCSNEYGKKTKKEDASEIVIDEVVGQLIAAYILNEFLRLVSSAARLNYSGVDEILFVVGGLARDFGMWPFILTSFLTFRFFDIVKPFPIGWIDRNIKGGLGVMLDDVVAGIFAGITSALIFWLITLI